MNSPIKWMGGKYRLRTQIVDMLPQHTCYCEPFGGAGWVLFEKAPSTVEVFNDLNVELINFFRVTKEKPEEFIERSNWFLISREIFEYFKNQDPEEMTDTDRAVRFYYLIHFSFGALTKNFIISPTQRPPRILGSIENDIRLVRNRLINTIIENRDFSQVIESYDRPSTFFYCDPPYYGLSDYRSQGSKPFTKEDHVRLKNSLSSVQGKFLVSINDHPEIRCLYSGFHIEEVKIKYSISRSKKSSVSRELLISNYRVPTVTAADIAA